MKGIDALRGMETISDGQVVGYYSSLKGINALRGMETSHCQNFLNNLIITLKGINALRGMETWLATAGPSGLLASQL